MVSLSSTCRAPIANFLNCKFVFIIRAISDLEGMDEERLAAATPDSDPIF